MSLTNALLNIEAFYRLVYWQAVQATTESTADYTLSYSGTTWMHTINMLWLHNPYALTRPLLTYTEQFFQRYNAEYSVIFNTAQPAPLLKLLWDIGYTQRICNPIYICRGLPRPRHVYREARLIRVANDVQQQHMLNILSEAFFIGTESGQQLVTREHYAEYSPLRHYLAYVQDEPVCCLTLMLSDHIVGVWNVATVRHFRQQGLAATLMLATLSQAVPQGYTDSVLLASSMGKYLYEEMGYQYIADAYFFGPD